MKIIVTIFIVVLALALVAIPAAAQRYLGSEAYVHVTLLPEE